jgi:hypothetical protein
MYFVLRRGDLSVARSVCVLKQKIYFIKKKNPSSGDEGLVGVDDES